MSDATIVFMLFALQALGAIVGAVAAVWAELAYLHAMKDGKLDRAERAHLTGIAFGLRVGMLVLLLSSLGIVIESYVQNTPAPVLTASYWLLISLSLLIVWATWARSRNRVSFARGSAIVFSAWWFLLFLTLGQLPLSFGEGAAAFIVLTFVFYGLLQAIRHFALRGVMSRQGEHLANR